MAENSGTPILFVGAAGPEREVYVSELARAGFVPLLAEDAANVNDQLERWPTPGVIIVELVATSKLAWALAARFAAAIPVIIVTALIRPDGANRLRARRLGCAAFIAKPYSPRQLIDVVGRVQRGERGIEVTAYSA